jgi:uncharacterized protein
MLCLRTHRRPGLFVFTLWLLVLAGSVQAAPTFPKLTGRVVDEAGLLSAETKRKLTQQLKAHEDKTTNQVVVVTLKSLQGDDIADYGYQLGRDWGIGQKDKNNGVLLIVAPNERKVRIEVGYGLEGTLTDALSKSIIENRIVPQFKQNNYPAGIEAGVSSILGVLDGSEDVAELRKAPASKRAASDNIFTPVIILVVLGQFMGMFMRTWISAGLVFGAGLFLGYVILNTILGGLAIGFFAGVFHLVSQVSRQGRYGGYYGGGFGGGGFGGGGGFSGGGGSFGGGGASGGW